MKTDVFTHFRRQGGLFPVASGKQNAEMPGIPCAPQFGVRELAPALGSATTRGAQSGGKPPHSKGQVFHFENTAVTHEVQIP